MDRTILVERDIEDGEKLLEAIKQAGITVESAFWLYYREFETWRLTMALPLYDQQGPRQSYAQILPILRQKQSELKIALTDITVISPRDKIVKLLRGWQKLEGSLQKQRFRQNSIENVYFEDIYIYFLGKTESEIVKKK